MKYNPDKHHRRSLRLKRCDYSSPGAYFITICTHQRECLFGEIAEGEMQLNPLGNVVRSHWLKLPTYHPHLQLDTWVVMPNHVHGILILTYGEVGAGLPENVSVESMNIMPKPAPTDKSTDMVGAGLPENVSVESMNIMPKPAPTDKFTNMVGAGLPENISVESMNIMPKPAPTGHHGIPEIIRGFKTFSARRINEIRKIRGIPVWQRNYYEHIIRNEESLQHIRQYIQNNAIAWQQA